MEQIKAKVQAQKKISGTLGIAGYKVEQLAPPYDDTELRNRIGEAESDISELNAAVGNVSDAVEEVSSNLNQLSQEVSSISSDMIVDVKVDGESVVADGVANLSIPDEYDDTELRQRIGKAETDIGQLDSFVEDVSGRIDTTAAGVIQLAADTQEAIDDIYSSMIVDVKVNGTSVVDENRVANIVGGGESYDDTELRQRIGQAERDIISNTSAIGITTETANEAYENAQHAAGRADQAYYLAQDADEKAEQLRDRVGLVETKADTAISNAATASTNAAEALTKATTAISNAAEAYSSASTAAQTANEALLKANTAISDASSAASFANEAVAKADTAISDAEQASMTAAEAKTTAENASSAVINLSNEVVLLEGDLLNEAAARESADNGLDARVTALEENPPTGGITDVKLDGTSVVTDGVANIPIADANNLGVAKIDRFFGIELSDTKKIATSRASASEIAAHSNQYKPIVPSNLVSAVDSVLCSTNPDEVLTDAQKTAAQQRLGISGGGGGEKEWVMKGVMGSSVSGFQPLQVDLTGCTELAVYCLTWSRSAAAAASYLRISGTDANGRSYSDVALINGIGSGFADDMKTTVARFQELTFNNSASYTFICTEAINSTGSKDDAPYAQLLTGYSISGITEFSIGESSNLFMCNFVVMAR